MIHYLKLRSSFAAVAAAALVAACGGGGGGTASTLKVQGVAATGYAIPDASVSVSCVSGSATSTTGADGGYLVMIYGGEGPCIVSVTSTKKIINGEVKDVPPYVLTSITPPAQVKVGVMVTYANVSPLSTAVVDALVSAKGASTVQDLVDISKNSIPTVSDLTQASAAVVTVINQKLTDMGVQPGGLLPADLGLNLIGKTDFIASTTDTPSTDKIDQVLDLLEQKNLISSSNTLDATVKETITSGVDAVVDPNPKAGNPNPAITGAG